MPSTSMVRVWVSVVKAGFQAGDLGDAGENAEFGFGLMFGLGRVIAGRTILDRIGAIPGHIVAERQGSLRKGLHRRGP